ncbi:MAG: AbrB/MazE/SpoVT family DNA-binding domain-containing protein, partial [Candidatus Thermoplasmatota archaeon]
RSQQSLFTGCVIDMICMKLVISLIYHIYLLPLGVIMLGRLEFFGCTRVGERGQIVLPAKLRKRFGIKPGDELLVLGIQGENRVGMEQVMLVKAEVLNEFLALMEERQRAIRQLISGDSRKSSRENG